MITFAIDPSRVLRVLVITIAALVVLSTLGQLMVFYLPDFPLRDPIAILLSVDKEQSIPNLYSTLMLIVSSLLFAIIAHASRRAGRPFARHWAALAIVFSWLALDEFASVHELSEPPIRSLLGIRSGPLYFAWVIPAAIAVVIFGIAFVRFVRHLPRPTRHGLLLATILYIGGAMGVEIVGSSYLTAHGLHPDMIYVLMFTVEETLEMLGVAVLVYVLLSYIPIGLPDTHWGLRIVASGGLRATSP